MSDRWKTLSVTSGIMAGTLAAFVAVLVLLPSTQGCEDDPRSTLCCSEFSVGADVSNVNFEVDAALSGRYTAFAQAASDIGATAAASVADVTNACRNIAIALGADPNDASVAGKNDREAATAWCALAKAKFQANAAVQAAGTLTIAYQPPVCSASLDAKAACEGGCKVDATCTEPSLEVQCEEGKLSGQCSGQCTGSCEGTVNAAAACEGSCEATCKGTCEGTCTADVNASVNCQGDCTGKCTGTCDGNSADGIDCAGDCVGQCQGSCAMESDADVQCNGKCEGTCTGKCTGRCELEANADIQCDGSCQGSCDVDFKAPKCNGEIKPPQCDASADCKASCDASIEAKAECSPPEVTITAETEIDSNLQGEFDLVVTTLKAHVPALLVVAEARGQSFIDAIAELNTNGEAFLDASVSSTKGAACGVAIVSTISAATESAGVALDASSDFLAVLSLNP